MGAIARGFSPAALEACIRPAGYFRQKARTIRPSSNGSKAHQGSLNALFAQPPQRASGPTAQTARAGAGDRGCHPALRRKAALLCGRCLYSPRPGTARADPAAGRLFRHAQQFLHRHLPAEEAVLQRIPRSSGRNRKSAIANGEAPQCDGCPLQKFLPARQRAWAARFEQFKPLPSTCGSSGKAGSRDKNLWHRMTSHGRPRRAFLIFLLILVPILLFIGWSQASLNLSFIRPENAGQTILLVVVSALIFLAFIIFALILVAQSAEALLSKGQTQKLGSRFKTKMVVAFLALTLIPVCFLFVFCLWPAQPQHRQMVWHSVWCGPHRRYGSRPAT